MGHPISEHHTLLHQLPTTPRGRTAKELSVIILETEEGKDTCTKLVHANYLGREFEKAEAALVSGADYVQD